MIAWKPFNAVLEVVCKYRQVTPFDLKSPARHQEICGPRRELFWLLKNLTDMSFPSIGRGVGGRDHTTVLAGVRKVEADMAADPVYAAELQQMRCFAAREITNVRDQITGGSAGDVALSVAQRVLAQRFEDASVSRAELRALAQAVVSASDKLSEAKRIGAQAHSEIAALN